MFNTVLIASLLMAGTISQPPPPSRGEQRQIVQEQTSPNRQASESDQPKSPPSAVNVTLNNQTHTEPAASSPSQEPPKQNPKSTFDWIGGLTVIFTGILASAAIIGAIVAYRTLWAVETQARATANSALAAKASADAVMLAERGYVSISHHSPGITIDETAVTQAGEESFGGYHEVTLKFGIANNGNTPARITDICMYHVVDSPANIPPPPTGPGTGEHLFLVKGDSTHDTRTFHVRNTDRNQLGLTRRLWVLGYVDYIDAFAIRRRAGYARFYDSDVDSRSNYEDSHGVVDEERFKKRNNLPFVTQPEYNYDRKRQKGEGNDWDEAPE